MSVREVGRGGRLSARCGFARLVPARRAIVAGMLALTATAGPALAETLSEALGRTYQQNPQLNAERARQRSTDETVPQALAGYRPQLMAQLSAGLIAVRNLIPGGDPSTVSSTLKPWAVGITINQTLFNGFKTANSVRQAEAQVQSGREALRNVEQGVLLDAVSAYMTVLGNQSLVEAQRLNMTFLRETMATTKKRLDAGDVTPTDVSQAEARLARGAADLNAAEVALAVSQATYREVIGAAPGRLVPAEPIDRLLPKAREEAVATARRENPTITGATYDLDAAQFAIKIAEAALAPTLGVQGNVSRNVQTDTTLGTSRTDQASVLGTLGVPIYDGGLAASQVRQSKEALGQARIMLDRIRNQAETAAVAAWVTHEGARISLAAAESEVRAASVALAGVQKENQAGQRTTLEVLNSQADLIAAKARYISAQRDRVVASYTLMAAVGRLDHAKLGLAGPDYDAQVHYSQVRDAWHGVRTPDGR